MKVHEDREARDLGHFTEVVEKGTVTPLASPGVWLQRVACSKDHDMETGPGVALQDRNPAANTPCQLIKMKRHGPRIQHEENVTLPLRSPSPTSPCPV